MNKKRFIGSLIVVAGSLALLLAIIFIFYSVEGPKPFGNPYIYPYQFYVVPSTIMGVVLLAVGIFFVAIMGKDEKQQTQKTP
jgi:hypothetical protein